MVAFIVLILTLVFVTQTDTQTVDRTREDRAVGADIVQAVVDLIRENCIYPNDRLFLRRLAYVESHDGLGTGTFRPGFYGGIWQVHKTMFDSLHNCAGVEHACSIIKDSLNITWQDARWEDLTKPLYSGLAASLYLLQTAGNSTPGEIAQQASFWTRNYNTEGLSSKFISEINKIQSDNCSRIDLTFILDSSGSIGYLNFMSILQFVKDVINELTIGPNDVHVAVVTFSDIATAEFGLNTYTTQSDLNTAVDNIYYESGGTNTADGIRLVREAIFKAANGSRNGATKAAIVVTDGASNNFNETIKEANLAKDDGIIMFAIGIGSINQMELDNIASPPTCTHVDVLSKFSDINGMLYEIRKSACRAPKVIPSNATIHNNINAIITITKPVTSKNESHVVGIKTTVNCGIVNVYASYNSPHPGPALYDIKDIALDGHPSVLFVNWTQNGRPLYVTYVGKELPQSALDLKNCNDSGYTVTYINNPKTEIICRDNGVERQCNKSDFLRPPYKDWLCSVSGGYSTRPNVPNPCTSTALSNKEMYHPYPYDDTWFIKCDLTGKMYITICPDGERYHQGSHACGSASPDNGGISGEGGGDGNKVPLDPDLTNPCSANAILNNHFFFVYSRDDTKFIHCDVWGHAWVLDCPANLVWNQKGQTCIVSTHSHGNPCTQAKLDQGITMFPHTDPHRYIHCDNGLNPWVQSCISGLIFSYAAQNCVYPDSTAVG